MTLQEFYNKCERHDWFYEYSDSHEVWERGEAAANALKITATQHGQAYVELLDAWDDYIYSGPAFGTEKRKRPLCPKDPDAGA